MLRFFENIFNRNKQRVNSEEKTPQPPHTSEINEKMLREKFRSIVAEIKLPEGALTQVNPQLLHTIQNSTYYHGTKGSIEEVRKNGFMIPKARASEATAQPLYMQIGGKNVFFTTDYEYALTYAIGNPEQVISIHVPTNLKCYEANFRILEEEVFPTLFERTREVLDRSYPQGYSNDVLLDCANGVFNLFLLHHGVDVITNSNGSFVNFVGQEKIPKI